MRNGILADYPPLERDESCEIAIIGGGITGALLADRFTHEGLDVLLLDKRSIGQGSTSASTALLQYELDLSLQRLSELIGPADAARAYQLCFETIGQLEVIAQSLPLDVGFRRRQSLQLASRRRDAAMLRQEHALRLKRGFKVDLLEKRELKSRFGLTHAAALLTHDAAEVDPYLFTHALLQRAISRSLRVFDRTALTKCKTGSGGLTLETDRGFAVRAKRAVFATGYEASEQFTESLTNLNTSFAVVSEPVSEFGAWHERCLIWETAKPYLYARTTSDDRIVIGGQDVASRRAVVGDSLIERKALRLQKQLARLFPDIRFEAAYAWAGVFAETRDSLPYIGVSPEHPDRYFALGYGANGVPFAMIAANVIASMHLHGGHPDARLFRFGR